VKIEKLIILGKFLQPPADTPLLHVSSNSDSAHFWNLSSLRASGVRLQISRREYWRRKSENDILWTKKITSLTLNGLFLLLEYYSVFAVQTQEVEYIQMFTRTPRPHNA